MPTFLLLPSPLLGPTTWQPVANELRRRGEAAAVAVYPTGTHDADAVVAAALAAGAALGDVVLVPHSNAGLVAPRLTQLLHVRATVYVDAALPDADATDTTLAPAAFLDFLTGLAVDEVLPPWTQWWADLDGLFPSASVRAAIEAEQPRLPLSYFTSRVPVPPGWTSTPQAYLAFGATYADEVGLAESSGWPVRVLAGEHLHALHDPVGVADAILDLAAACG